MKPCARCGRPPTICAHRHELHYRQTLPARGESTFRTTHTHTLTISWWPVLLVTKIQLISTSMKHAHDCYITKLRSSPIDGLHVCYRITCKCGLVSLDPIAKGFLLSISVRSTRKDYKLVLNQYLPACRCDSFKIRTHNVINDYIYTHMYVYIGRTKIALALVPRLTTTKGLCSFGANTLRYLYF